MPRSLYGGSGDDRLQTSAEFDRLYGLRGNDHLTTGAVGGGAWGGMGDDTLVGGGNGVVQSHLYGGAGADVLYLDIGNSAAPYGDHAWGEQGPDQFIFIGGTGASNRITGRIDDFDPSRDEIWIDDQKIDLRNPPQNVRIVELYGQPWLLIDERALFTLEGARASAGLLEAPPGSDEMGNANGEERHFINWPEEWANGVPASADIPYLDYVSYFPRHESPARDWEMQTPNYTAGPDLIQGAPGLHRLIGGDGADTIIGTAAPDLLHGGERSDLLYGGGGADSLSGGLDNDRLWGGDGADILYGGGGHDTLWGDAGADRLHGNNGRDEIYGGSGRDTLFGGLGSDALYGGDGDDILYAAIPEDEGRFPNPAFDSLYGGEGNDSLFAAADGFATLTGGAGDDSFTTAPGAHLVLTDFQPGFDFLNLNGLSPGSAQLNQQLYGADRVQGLGNEDLLLVLHGSATMLLQGMAMADRQMLLASIGQDPSLPELKHPVLPPPSRVPNPLDPNPPTNTDDDSEEEPSEEEDDEGKSSDCFVAGACYRSALHPDVRWLRWYRDAVLRQSRAGAFFVGMYYHLGPPLAASLRRAPRLSNLCRKAIAAFVRRERKRLNRLNSRRLQGGHHAG